MQRCSSVASPACSRRYPIPTSGDSVGSYGANCVKCHTTGWDQKANNGNFGYLAHQANGATPAWDTTWTKNPSVSRIVYQDRRHDQTGIS